jgi:hypothetical protein
MILCDYGCGQEAKFQFKNGKWCCSKSPNSCPAIGKKKSEIMKQVWREQDKRDKILLSRSILEVKEKKLNSQKKAWNKPGTKEKLSESMKKVWSDPEMKQKIIEAIKGAMNKLEVKEKNRERMLNGGSAYASSFIKNPSKEGTKFINLVLEIFPASQPEFKILNYSVDSAIVEYKIALEWDGWYHFNCQEAIVYHNKRQKEIEAEGWIFLRYNIFKPFPTKEQIKEDIENIFKV